MYFSPIPWAPQIFFQACPREYEIKEMSNMTASGKEKFFKNVLEKAADAASRWKTLEVLGRMPKTFASEFAKTVEGRSIFPSF